MSQPGSASPLVSLLFRLRNAAYDNEWLDVYEILCARMRELSDDDIRQHVIRFYSSIEQNDDGVVERDIAALQSEIFRQAPFSSKRADLTPLLHSLAI